MNNPASLSLLAAALLGTSLAASAAGNHEARAEAAREAAMALIGELGSTLQSEMKSAGPAAAIGVCRDEAPRIAGELSRRNGWRVTRVSERVRNPMLGMPDAWESEVLQRFQTRHEAGDEAAQIAFSEVVTEADGQQYFRYMQAIGTKPACLVCHGATAQIPAVVQEALSTAYPRDRATGYSVGDIRGAVSIKQPLAIPLLSKVGDS